MQNIEDIKREIGSTLYEEFLDRANYEYEKAEVHDLTRLEYQTMSIRWQYHRFRENLRKSRLEI